MSHVIGNRRATHVMFQPESNTLRVCWSDTLPERCSLERDQAHVVEFDGEWLRQQSYDDVTLESEQGERRAMNDSVMSKVPHVSYDSVMKSEEGLFSWLSNLNQYGICVIDDAPKQTGVINAIGNLIGPLSHTIYGDTFQVKADPKPINVAYTDLALPPHMDLAYFESPPGLQMLHCIQFDEAIKGGESTFIDCHAVAEEFQLRNPESFQNLVRIPATFQKDHVDRANPVKMFYQRPHIQTNHYGQVVSVYWAPPFEGPLRVSSKDVDAYYSAYAAFEDLLLSDEMWAKYGCNFRMNEGQVVVFNNRRLLHGRKAFTSQDGVRHLEGCYLDVDMFLCKYRVLGEKVMRGTSSIGGRAVKELRAGAGTWW
jgi:alpha-ketoglutarate-dependent taurine dioxygenase